MADECGRNVIVNFIYCIKTFILFMYRSIGKETKYISQNLHDPQIRAPSNQT